MDSKYYTPSIEEFYIGFEFEYLAKPGYTIDSDVVSSEKVWQKCSDFGDFNDYDVDGLGMISYQSDKGNIRVKYLDKSDIESCGFTYIGGQMIENGRQDYEGIFQPLGLLKLSYKPICNKLTIKYPNYLRDGSGRFNNYINVFDGYIKNLSELRKLLKQLGIDENK